MALYRGYFVPGAVDPSGERVWPVVAIVNGQTEDDPWECGKRNVNWIRLELTGDITTVCPNGGYFVQLVEVHSRVKTCDNECPDLIDPEDPNVQFDNKYWEWWYVRPGKNVPWIREVWEQQKTDKLLGTDSMAFDANDRTVGAITQRRTLRYYCKGKIGDLGHDGKPVAPWINGGVDDSGEQPSMGEPGPKFWNDQPEGEWLYWTNAKWNCCNRGENDVRMTDGAPAREDWE